CLERLGAPFARHCLDARPLAALHSASTTHLVRKHAQYTKHPPGVNGKHGPARPADGPVGSSDAAFDSERTFHRFPKLGVSVYSALVSASHRSEPSGKRGRRRLPGELSKRGLALLTASSVRGDQGEEWRG